MVRTAGPQQDSTNNGIILANLGDLIEALEQSANNTKKMEFALFILRLRQQHKR